MARITQCGFELNSVTNGMEGQGWITTGTFTISSTTVRSGTYAMRNSSMVSGTRVGIRVQHQAAAGNGPFFHGFGFNVHTLPSAANRIFFVSGTGDFTTAPQLYMTLDNTGALKLFDTVGQIGNTSAVLSVDTWYYIEVKFDKGNTIGEARLNGTIFATSSSATYTAGELQFAFGANLNAEAQNTGDWFWDDVVVNDSTAGGTETGYPGPQKIIRLKPAAAGDNNAWSLNSTLADQPNNFSRVKEVTPDDGTTYNGDLTNGDTDDYAIDSATGLIAANDTLNVLIVKNRCAAALAGSDATFLTRIKASSNGTVSSSGSNAPTGTAYSTSPSQTNVQLFSYTKPGTSNVWTQADLATTQIGAIISATNTNACRVTALWLEVSFTPAIPTNWPVLQFGSFGQPTVF